MGIDFYGVNMKFQVTLLFLKSNIFFIWFTTCIFVVTISYASELFSFFLLQYMNLRSPEDQSHYKCFATLLMDPMHNLCFVKQPIPIKTNLCKPSILSQTMSLWSVLERRCVQQFSSKSSFTACKICISECCCFHHKMFYLKLQS